MVTFYNQIGINNINNKNLITMKKLLLILMVVGYALTLTSCSTTEDCWAYRDCAKNHYNNSKNRPSVAGAMGKHRAKLRY